LPSNDREIPGDLGNYVAGAFTPSEGALLDVTNPSRGDVIAGVLLSTDAQLGRGQWFCGDPPGRVLICACHPASPCGTKPGY
jgi:hypothetical protein